MNEIDELMLLRAYVAVVNSDIQSKMLEIYGLRAQLEVANATIEKVKKQLSDLTVTE